MKQDKKNYYGNTVNVNAKLGKRSHVGRIKRIQRSIGSLDSPIASKEFVIKEDADFGYAVTSSY